MLKKLSTARKFDGEPYHHSLCQVDNQRSLTGLPCENSSVEELLDMLVWELKRLPMIHNGPILADQAKVQDDTDLFTTL